jgi:hypothetical protein
MPEDIKKKIEFTNKLDVGITQGAYWGGAQLPYWLITLFTILPITGILGMDHMLLRSPLTAIAKFISFIPLFGFWYFFDIAQVLGEEESVRKHGFAVPFGGPQGIGAGMFINKDSSNLAPPKTPTPWGFLAYAIATILFTVLPINKVVIGDYGGAILQSIMSLLFFTPTVLLALFWGFYDEYRLVLDTRNVFEKGAARVIPASLILDPYFKANALGPVPGEPDLSVGIITILQKKILEFLHYFFGVIYEIKDDVVNAVNEVKDTTVRLTKKQLFTAREIADASMSVASAKARTEKAMAEAVPLIIESGTAATASIAPQISVGAAEATMKIAQQSPEIIKDYADLGIELGKNVGKVIEKDVPTVINATEKAVKKAGDLTEQIIKTADKTADKIGTITEKAVETAGKTAEKIGNVTEKAVASAENTIEKIGNISEKAVATAGTTAEKIGNSTAKLANSVGDTVGTIIEKQLEKAQKGGSYEEFLNQTRQKAIRIRDASDKLHDEMVDLSHNIPSLITSTTEHAGDIVVNGLNTAVTGALNTLSSVNQDGGMLNTGPSVSTTVVLFSVAMLAVGGYIMYTLRNTISIESDPKDDPPPNPRAVRKPTENKG